jgi:molybdate transport system substrate-binding protein
VKKPFLFLSILVVALLSAGCAAMPQSPPDDTTELLVSAAASLTNPLKEIQALYESEANQVRLVFNFGGSGALQQQIERGAPSDLFLSAGQAQMEALIREGLIRDEHVAHLLTNELVLIVSSDSELAVDDAEALLQDEVKVLAIGQPETVPAGTYAQQALLHEGLWDRLKPKVVFAKDVRQVLSYVETGNAEAGFVYRSDALQSKLVKIGYTAAPSSYSPAEYPAAMLQSTKHSAEAERFLAFLQGESARRVFEAHGFGVPPKAKP